MMQTANQRPKFLNLTEIRQPVAAIASILHRISGAGLFVMLPVLIWGLQQSLESPESFQRIQDLMSRPASRLVLLGLVWAYLHHLLMGIRILLIDMHIGVEKAPARASAIAVLVVSLGLTFLAGIRLIGGH